MKSSETEESALLQETLSYFQQIKLLQEQDEFSRLRELNPFWIGNKNLEQIAIDGAHDSTAAVQQVQDIFSPNNRMPPRNGKMCRPAPGSFGTGGQKHPKYATSNPSQMSSGRTLYEQRREKLSPDFFWALNEALHIIKYCKVPTGGRPRIVELGAGLAALVTSSRWLPFAVVEPAP